MCPEDLCPDYAGRAPARFTALLADVGVVYGHLSLPISAREQLPSIDNAWKGFLGQAGNPSGAGVEIEGLPVPEGKERADWLDWIQRITNGIDQNMDPTLSYVHLPAPHVPWVTNPSGTHYERPEQYTEVEGVEGGGRWTMDPEPALLGFQRHLYQLGLLDRKLGRLFDQLDETDMWDGSMVIVVADHGASFVPGEHRRWPYEDNREDLYRVPLFVKYPNQTGGGVDDRPAFGIDILPTIVDALAIDSDWSFDGISLLGSPGGDRTHQPVWWCCNGDGVSTDLSSLFAQVERNHDWIRNQDDWTAVAGVGEHAELIGMALPDLVVSEDSSLVWSLDLGADLADVDIESGVIQTLLTGRIQLPPSVDSNVIAVAVNGVVGGFGFVSRDSADGGSIRALIAEPLIADGYNEIEILVPNPSGSGWLTGSSEVLTLDLITEDGRVLDIRAESSRRLQVDKITPTDTGWEVTGWAADITKKETPATIYIFVGDTLLVAGPPNEDNKNVVRWFDSEDLLRSGFAYEIEGSLVPVDVNHLTVVAEFDTYAIADTARLGN